MTPPRALPPLPPRGLKKEEAASYLGLSVDKFEKRVRIGSLPAPLPFGRPQVWDRQALDRVLDKLSRSPGREVAPPLSGEALALEAIHAGEDALRHRKAQSRRA